MKRILTEISKIRWSNKKVLFKDFGIVMLIFTFAIIASLCSDAIISRFVQLFYGI